MPPVLCRSVQGRAKGKGHFQRSTLCIAPYDGPAQCWNNHSPPPFPTHTARTPRAKARNAKISSGEQQKWREWGTQHHTHVHAPTHTRAHADTTTHPPTPTRPHTHAYNTPHAHRTQHTTTTRHRHAYRHLDNCGMCSQSHRREGDGVAALAVWAFGTEEERGGVKPPAGGCGGGAAKGLPL